jgi:hypothetical protein
MAIMVADQIAEVTLQVWEVCGRMQTLLYRAGGQGRIALYFEYPQTLALYMGGN